MPRAVPIALNQATTLLMGVLAITLISHVVPERVNGDYGLFLTLTQIGLLLSHSGLVNHASRYWQREQGRFGQYARFLLKTSWRNSGPLALVLLAVGVTMSVTRHDAVWLLLVPLLLASNLAIAMFSLASLVLNAGERHWGMLALNGLAAAARAVLPVGLALLLGPSLVSLSSGFALHALAVALAIVILFRGTDLSQPFEAARQSQWRQELRDFGRPFILLGAGGWCLQYADRWIVAGFYGQQQAGLFNLASNIASIVPSLVCAGLMQRVFPAVFRKSDRATTAQDWRNLARQCDRFTYAFLGLTLAGLVSLQLVGPFFVGWLISANYGPSMPLLFPAGMAALAMQTNQFQYLLLQGQHNSAAMVKVMLILAAIRTAGSLVAGAISWPVLLAWLIISTALVAFLGRLLIQRVALSNFGEPKAGALLDSIRG